MLALLHLFSLNHMEAAAFIAGDLGFYSCLHIHICKVKISNASNRQIKWCGREYFWTWVHELSCISVKRLSVRLIHESGCVFAKCTLWQYTAYGKLKIYPNVWDMGIFSSKHLSHICWFKNRREQTKQEGGQTCVRNTVNVGGIRREKLSSSGSMRRSIKLNMGGKLGELLFLHVLPWMMREIQLSSSHLCCWMRELVDPIR